MKRWHEEMNIARREWQEHRLIHVEFNKMRGVGAGPFQRKAGADPRDVDCPCDEQMGRFRKQDAYDCGNPGCLVCHGDKFPRRKPTRQELIAALRFKEQWQELCQGEREWPN
jgi:hypothetical protein